jgi:glutamyl-tRNA reductase
MRIGMIGINHKLAELGLRELLAKACHRRFGLDRSTHGDHSFILLSTCNRTEVYFTSEDLAETHSYLLEILRLEVEEEFDQKLYSYFGHDCFFHLSRVVAGLDSAIIAETEIQGQVKAAYEASLIYARIPHELHYLFQKALKIGKQVRTELPLKPGLPDLEDAVLLAGSDLFADLAQPKILFVGASDINRKVMAFMKRRSCADMTLCNRCGDHGAALAGELGIRQLAWERFGEWTCYDWIIFATKSSQFLLNRNSIADRSIGRKLIVDLSVPRNVDPLLAAEPHITLVNIDQLNRSLESRSRQIRETIGRAEQMVEEAARRHVHLFQSRGLQRLELVI